MDVSNLALDPAQALSDLQNFLDIAGIVDPTPISDGCNLALYLLQGDLENALICSLGLLPYGGDAAKLAARYRRAGLATNPFAGKTPEQIDEMLRKRGFEARVGEGKDILKGEGAYVNPKTGRSYHIDPMNRFTEPPHVDVNRRTHNGRNNKIDKRRYPGVHYPQNPNNGKPLK